MEEIKIEGGEAEPTKGIFKKALPKWLWIVVLAVLLTGGIALAAWIYFTNYWRGAEVIIGKKESPAPQENIFDTPCPLDGVLTTKLIAERRPLGIMIENTLDARPQSGLLEASLVYETPTEGGITRFLAFYVENDVTELGPVRSARTYFVDWADEVKAVYAHCGGSAIAIEELEDDELVCDINQFQFGSYFWRDKSRLAPHNLYTSTDRIRKAAAQKKCGLKADYSPWQFKDEAPKELRGVAQTIVVNFSSPAFRVVYRYEPEQNVYLREASGGPHIDKKSSKQIAPKSLAVIHADRIASESDGAQQSHVVTIGSGPAEIFMDGKMIEGRWSKTAEEERTRFYDSSGQEIIFIRGQIWISVLPPGKNITVE